MKAITQLTSQKSQNSQKFIPPSSSPVPLKRTPSPWKQHEAASPSPNIQHVSGDIPVQQNTKFSVSPLSRRKLPLVPQSSEPYSHPPVPPRDLADTTATSSPVDDGYSRIRDVLPTRRKRSSLCLEDVTQFCEKHNLKITLRHTASDSNLLSPGTSAVPDLGQNKRSLSRDQLSDNSSSKVTEKQKAFSMDPLDVFGKKERSLLHSKERSHTQLALNQSGGKLQPEGKRSKVSLRFEKEKACSMDALDVATPDDGYCDIKDFVDDDKCFYPGKKRRSSFCLEEEQSRVQRKPSLRPSASNLNLVDSSAGTSTIVSALKMLSRFDSSQMEHLIEMAKLTAGMESPDDLDNSAMVSQEPTPIPQHLSQFRNKQNLPKFNALEQSPLASKEFKKRPTQLNLSSGFWEEEVHTQCDDTTAAQLNGDAAGRRGAEEKREAATPSFVIESDQSETPKQQLKRSDGLLKAPESSNAMKFKLGTCCEVHVCIEIII